MIKSICDNPNAFNFIWYIFKKLIPTFLSSYTVAGSLCLGLGVTMTVMTAFLAMIWTKLNDYVSDAYYNLDHI